MSYPPLHYWDIKFNISVSRKKRDIIPEAQKASETRYWLIWAQLDGHLIT